MDYKEHEAVNRYTMKIDPRYYQLTVQASLLLWSMAYLDFTLPLSHVIATVITGLVTQWGFTRYYALPANFLSVFNAVFSILLLLHVNSWHWLALASFIAISSKFLIRFNNKHLFNPSNIGIVATLLLTSSVWVASGQWGQTMWLALLFAGLGLIVLIGFSRMLTSMSFLITFSLLTFGRAIWLGDPWVIPVHQLQNGAVLIFAFFMLSDPMTTPDHRIGRIIFGSVVGIIGWVLQYGFYIPNAFLYALALAMPVVLLLNQRYDGQRYQWPLQKWRI